MTHHPSFGSAWRRRREPAARETSDCFEAWAGITSTIVGRFPSHFCLAGLALLGVASACGDDAPGGAPCPEGDAACACARPPCTPAITLGDLGRFTEVAALSDGGQVVVTFDATKTNLVVLFVDADGARAAVHVVDGWRLASDALGDRLVDVDAGRWATVAVGAGDLVHVAWFDADEGELRYAQGTAAAGFSTPEVVDGDGPATRGTHASIGLDAAGLPHIAYRDETKKGLRYARRDARGVWQTRGLDGCAGEPGCPASAGAGGEDYGEYAALAFVPAAGGGLLPRVAFYDRLRGDLKMAAQSADGTWVTSTLDGRDPVTFADTGDVGRFVSVAATPTRQLGLAYFDATRGTLSYLSPGGEPRTIDDGRRVARPDGGLRRDLVGQHVHLGYDTAGRAHLVYADASRPGLRHAVVAGEGAATVRALELPAGGWIDFVVAGDQLVGHYGAFLPGAAPRTRLERLVVDLAEIAR